MTREEREDAVSRDCNNCAYYVNGANDEACDGCFADEYEHPNFKPKAQPCDDCISRQAVINAINQNCIYENEYNLTASHIMEKVKQLPPVTLQRCEDWYDVPSDEMTLEQARQAVKDLRKKLAERLEQESCDDCINRQAAIDTIESWLSCDDYNETERHIMRAMQSVLYDLPSVTPKEKTGHWTPLLDNDGSPTLEETYGKVYRCSACGFISYGENFCGNCGAKMSEPQKSEDN